MRRRTYFGLVVQSFLFGAFALFLTTYVGENKSIAQGPPPAPDFKRKEVKLKEKEAGEKAKEKNRAKNLKEKADLAPIEEYYRDYLIPLLTQEAPESVNAARKEFFEDIEAIEKNKELLAKFNPYFLKEMRELAMKGADGKVYASPTRIDAAVLIGRLKTDGAKPFTGVHPTLLEMIDQKENDGLISSALFTLYSHLRSPGTVSEKGRVLFTQKLQQILTTPAPLTRDTEAHNYLLQQVIECLTEIAKSEPDKEPSKLAAAALSPALLKIIDEQKSEWLVEIALASFGTFKTVNLTEDDAVTLEKAIAKFAKQSLKDWKKRIVSSTGGAAAGGMGMGPGGMGGSSLGSGGPGGKGSMGLGGSSDGEGGGSMPGGATGAPRTRRPFEDQPKEVKNARRIAHQRFERIHMALNGSPLNFVFQKKTVTTTPVPGAAVVEKGLLSLIPAAEKEKLDSLLSSVDLFQKELNDDKVSDLASLTLAVAKSVKKIRAASDLILGETKEVVITDEDNLVPGADGK
jgi:uncharacterized membrane protein YgcG